MAEKDKIRGWETKNNEAAIQILKKGCRDVDWVLYEDGESLKTYLENETALSL